MRAFAILALIVPPTLIACNNDDKDTNDPISEDTDTEDTEDTEDTTTEPELQTVVDLAVATPRFSILVDAVTRAGLASALNGVTVFAPNNDAFEDLFAALGVDGVDDLSVAQLTAVLTYHVVAGEVDSAAAIAVAQGAGAAASLGGSLTLTLDGDTLKVDGASVIAADIYASNGIIHEIDSVLLPDLIDVITTDAQLSSLTAAVLAADGSEAAPNIVGTLRGAGPFTVLAPTNDAFAAMLSANGAADLGAFVGAVGIDTVIDVLLYHVAAGRLPSSAVVATSSFSTLGGEVTVTVEDGAVVFNQGVTSVPGTNDAPAEVVDILTSNGVIHKIGAVITPAM
ncbi:MAG TPA: fasciclin domain-containing protein [Myxococcota bacterium]|nr:fasciclin domain-containing protein [Myxococcota bacterium]